MNFKRIIVFCLMLIFPMLASAQSATEDLKGILNNLHSLQAQFTQTVVDGSGSTIQQSSGVMSLQRPGLFYWEVRSPSKQVLVADGKKVWFYDVELDQVTVQPQQTINSNSPAMLLSGSTQELTQQFLITRSGAANEQVFKLVPKVNNSLFASVQLFFHNNQLQKMRLLDSLGQATVVDFSQVRTNLSLRPNLFHFTVPNGVDVVHE